MLCMPCKLCTLFWTCFVLYITLTGGEAPLSPPLITKYRVTLYSIRSVYSVEKLDSKKKKLTRLGNGRAPFHTAGFRTATDTKSKGKLKRKQTHTKQKYCTSLHWGREDVDPIGFPQLFLSLSIYGVWSMEYTG